MNGSAEPGVKTNPKPDVSVIEVYRQAARLNRNPFSRVTRNKQTLLLIFSIITILLALSIFEVKDISMPGSKLGVKKGAENYAGIVTSVCASYYLLTFILSAKQDQKRELLKTKTAHPRFVRYFISKEEEADRSTEIEMVLAQSQQLRERAHEEFTSRLYDPPDIIEEIRKYASPVIQIEGEIARILAGARKRVEPDYVEWPQLYSELIQQDIPLTEDEKKRVDELDTTRAEALRAASIHERQRQERNKISEEKEAEYEAKADELINRFNERTLMSIQETQDALAVISDLSRYRRRTTLIEVIFPSSLGVVSVLIEIIHLCRPDWLHVVQ